MNAAMGSSAGSPRTPTGREVVRAGLVALVATAVQGVYLFEIRDTPTFSVPIIDAAVYHDAATRFAGGERLIDDAFWQPPLFPATVGLLYRLTGPSVIAAKLVLAAIAVGSCLLVQAIARWLFGSTVGLVAGLIAATYGPLVFFGTELLPVGLAVFLDLVAIAILLRCVRTPTVGGWLVFGAAAGAATVTVPNGAVFMALGILTVLSRRGPSAADAAAGSPVSASRSRPVLALVLGFAAVLAPVTVRNRVVSGRWVVLSTNGGMNLFIGNGADSRTRGALRPGEPWRRLARQATAAGAETRAEQNSYFVRRTLSEARRDPVGFLAAVTRKSRELLNGREIPRNLDPYVRRDDSRLLSALLWRAGPFSFPFGLLLPLAAGGAIAAFRDRVQDPAKRRGQVALAAFIALYGVSIVAVFVSGRYRVPMAVTMIPFAAFGVTQAWHHLFHRDPARPRRDARSATTAALLGAAAAAWPIRTATDGFNFRAEEAMCVGVEMASRGNLDDAERYLRAALTLNPRYPAAAAHLGAVLAARGRVAEAETLLSRAAGWDDTATEPRLSLADLLRTSGRQDQACVVYADVLPIDPTSPDALAGVARCHLNRGEVDEGIQQWHEAVRLAENPGPFRIALADALSAAARYEQAIEQYRIALWEADPEPAVLNRVAWLLATCPQVELRDCAQATALAERLCEVTEFGNAVALDTLAAAHAECGRFTEAVRWSRRAIARAAADGDRAAVEAFTARLHIYESRLARDPPAVQP